ncbi:hypothetical protein [Paraburkholderia tagetis]|uniref:hypothetical protein n=1 Tax=Paraburkholderia tagetis TaxID=2913261 RepID=UPI001EE4B968|nr:hypothetical protein [Paraburkholderia tagetis]
MSTKKFKHVNEVRRYDYITLDAQNTPNSHQISCSCSEVDQTLVLRSPNTPYHALMRGGVRVAAMLHAQTPAALALIERAVAHEAETYRSDAGELRIPMCCVLASALKP